MQLFTHIYQLKLIPPTGKYNNVRAEAYVMGKMVCAIEDTGFSNVDQIMDKLTTLLPKKISNTRVQFKITNIDKELTQMYQRLV